MTDVQRARIAVGATFAIHGAVTGTFAARVPWIAEHVGTDPGRLGLAFLFMAAGAVSVMPFAGRVIHRARARVIVPVLMVAWCLSVLLPSLAPTVPLLCAAMLGYGAAAGAADVAMNAQGVVVERAVGRSIMSSLHGLWSLGGLAGSGLGVLAAHADIPAPTQFLVVALCLTGLAILTSRWLPDTAAAPPGEAGPAFALPGRAVLPIALVGFAAIFAEVASSDWAAVYLTDIVHAPPGIAAMAYSGFATTMAIVRLVGDRVVDRIGPVWTVRTGGAAATVGALVVSLARTPFWGILGFALIGVGVAVVVPLAFTAAANAGPHPAQQIAGVATIAYGAGMVAPAAIGGLAQATSLSVSFVLVATLTALLTVGASVVRRGTPATSSAAEATHPTELH